MIVRLTAVVALTFVSLAPSLRAEDAARKICMADAKRLCPDAVKAASRHRAEVCLAQRIAETTPACHDVVAKGIAARGVVSPASKR